ARKLLETLAEDPLRTIAGQHALIQRHAAQARRDRGLGNSLGGGDVPEIVEPGLKAAGSAGRRQRRCCRQSEDCAYDSGSEEDTKGHRDYELRNDSRMNVSPTGGNVPANRGQNMAPTLVKKPPVND